MLRLLAFMLAHMDKYLKALSRDDLSQWLVHLCKPLSFPLAPILPPHQPIEDIPPIQILRKILSECTIAASRTMYAQGVVSFSDVPPQNWQELIETNPSGRKGFGMVFSKSVMWRLGARPAIYTDEISAAWPASNRHLLVETDLRRSPPLDWTHEREWRYKGDFRLIQECLDIPEGTWWWPVVQSTEDAQAIFQDYPGIDTIYVIDRRATISRN
jgi:hypothetical protein